MNSFPIMNEEWKNKFSTKQGFFTVFLSLSLMRLPKSFNGQNNFLDNVCLFVLFKINLISWKQVCKAYRTKEDIM